MSEPGDGGGSVLALAPAITRALGAGCRHPSFEITSTAGLYSTLAGVMAGFAFLALADNLLATERGGEDPRIPAEAGVALAAAFVSLLLVSISYAILAGDTTSGPRAAVVEVISGGAFAAAALQMLYAIGFLIGIHGRPLLALHTFFRILGVGLCPLVLVLVLLGSNDYIETHHGSAAIILRPAWGVLVGALLLAGGLLWRAGRSGPGRLPGIGPGRPDPSYVVVAFAGSSILACALVDALLGPCGTVSPFVVLVVLVVTGAVLLNQMIWFGGLVPAKGVSG
jgi:hypothetical protein